MPDAVVIGAGPNGLVAANLLADAGWSVLVIEEQDAPGGAVRSGDYLGPGWTADLCSAFYPVAAASPVIRGLGLERHGLHWSRAPTVLAHPLPDGRCATLSQDALRTAHSLAGFAGADEANWLALVAGWERLRPRALRALFTPFPPVWDALRWASSAGPGDALRLARLATVPARELGAYLFDGEGGRLLLTGCALHTDLAPEQPGSGLYGMLIALLGQTYGFPVPEGGAGQLTDALVRRLRSRGGQLRCGHRVTQVIVRGGTAVAVRTADGLEVAGRRAVIAAVDAPQLFTRLVGLAQLPAGTADALRLFHWDHATFKVDWALTGPVPWTAAAARSAGTVHLGSSLETMSGYAAQLAAGQVPAEPFLLCGQMTTADRTRSPTGTEMLWAYTHVPQQPRADAGGAGLTGRWDEREKEAMADRIEQQLERFAPGLRGLVQRRRIWSPRDLQEHDANLHGGALNGGTAALHQQLVFRPFPGLGRAETPVRRLFLGSASAHPGGGVHGGPGANAARAALRSRWASRATVAAARALLR